MFKLIFGAQSLYWVLAPNGKQIGKVAKEVAKHADDVVRVASKNPGFWESIPIWAWIIIGIIVVIIVIYAISES